MEEGTHGGDAVGGEDSDDEVAGGGGGGGGGSGWGTTRSGGPVVVIPGTNAAVDALLLISRTLPGPFEAAAAHLSNGELVEVVMICGFYRMLAGFLNSMRVPVTSVITPKLAAAFNRPNRRQGAAKARL